MAAAAVVVRQTFGDMLEKMSDQGLFQIERAIKSAESIPSRSAVIIPLPTENKVSERVPSEEGVHHADSFPGSRYTPSLGEEDDRSTLVVGNDPNDIFSRARFWARRRKVSGEVQLSTLREYRAIPFGKTDFDRLWKDYCSRGEESVLGRYHREIGLTQLDFYGCVYEKGFISTRKYILSMVFRKVWCMRTLSREYRWVRVCTPLRKRRHQNPIIV